MQKLTLLLSKQSRHGIISTRKLKATNLRLLRLLQSNQEMLSGELQAEGIEILDDLLPLYSADSLKLYLRYHYGKEVNISDLLDKHRTVYVNIQMFGPVREVISGWGFKVAYDHQLTDEMILKKLAESADEAGNVKLSRKLYNALLYRAGLKGMELTKLVAELGYTYLPRPAIDLDEVVRLKESQKKSFNEIAAILGISKSAAHKYYTKARNKHGRPDIS